MARNQHTFAKRQREVEKKRKAEEKRAKRQNKNRPDGDGDDSDSSDTLDDSSQTAAHGGAVNGTINAPD